jgi:hypothetical protein
MAKPKFPDIRIAGDSYKVIFEHHEEGEGLLSKVDAGAFHRAERTIRLNTAENSLEMRKTLLHELIHAADACFGADDLEEHQVVSVENGLWQVFRDNPKLAAFIFRGVGALKNFPLVVGGDLFEVQFHTCSNVLRAADAAEMAGSVTCSRRIIHINNDMHPDEQRKTLLHELVHASDRLYGKCSMTESQVVAQEHGLWTIFRHNYLLAEAIFNGDAK